MFRELPAWGVYIRDAKDIQFNNVSLVYDKKNYRTVIVLDDVHHSQFISMDIKELVIKKDFISIVLSKLLSNSIVEGCAEI